MIKQSFNGGWCFYEGASEGVIGSLSGAGVDRGIKVTLPHDASVGKERNPAEASGSGNGFFREESYHYTKDFVLHSGDTGKNIWIEFEGAYHNSFVYINHSFAGKCPYGYSNFYINATPYVRFDSLNTIKVVLNNGVPSSRWYSGGGIYRDVNLMIADRMHFICDGIHMTVIDIGEEYAAVRAESVVEYTGIGFRDIKLTVQILNNEGAVVAENSMPVTVQEHSRHTFRQTLGVENPNLWDVDTPYLYHYRAFLKENNVLLDEEHGTFGIRKLQLDPKYGLRVNGKTVKLRGGCVHHDNGIIGAAEFAHAAEVRVKAMKDAGYNAIRNAHCPMSRKLLDACDKYGMLVMDEFADVWTSSKVDFDYGMYLTEWWEHDIRNLVHKDYNHPCVIMYSIGNEISETGDKFDVQWGKKLADKIHALDHSRYVVNCLNLMLSVKSRIGEILSEPGSTNSLGFGAESIGINQEINAMMNNLGELMKYIISTETAGNVTEEAYAQVDIAGYNYAACRYGQDTIQYPNRIIVGSETYPKDLDFNWELVEKYPNIIGDFCWTAWDYLGEAGIGKITYKEKRGLSIYSDYPYKAAYCGDINLISDRRPISYWRQTVWSLRDQPYLAVQPPCHYGVEHEMTEWSMTNAVRSWNWSGYEGKPVIVEAYSDAEEAVLYINGLSMERKAIGKQKKNMVLFETTYIPGTLEIVAYRNGKEVGRDRIITAQSAVGLVAKSDCAQIPADESDIAFIEISICDQYGNLNTEIEKPVSVSLEGPGVILGFGSADPASEENYFDRKVKAYEGRMKAAIRGNGKPGTITVIFVADGCESIKVEIEAV